MHPQGYINSVTRLHQLLRKSRKRMRWPNWHGVLIFSIVSIPVFTGLMNTTLNVFFRISSSTILVLKKLNDAIRKT